MFITLTLSSDELPKTESGQTRISSIDIITTFVVSISNVRSEEQQQTMLLFFYEINKEFSSVVYTIRTYLGYYEGGGGEEAFLRLTSDFIT